MALNANASKNAGGTGVEPVAPGTYPARLVTVADIGLQAQRPYKGEEKPPAYEILTTYELVDEFMKDDDGEDILDKPRWQSENFPLYSLTSERANSTKRYLALDPEKKYDGDWGALLGMPVLVTLVNNPAKDGRVFTNIANVSPMRPKEAEATAPLVNGTVMFDMDNPDLGSFAALPSWVQDKIKNGLEYEGSALDRMTGEETVVGEGVAIPEDEVPF